VKPASLERVTIDTTVQPKAIAFPLDSRLYRPGLASHFAEPLARVARLFAQQKTDHGKLYALHAPEVECLAKGKAHGYLAAVIASGVESAVVVGGLSALGAALVQRRCAEGERNPVRDGAEGGRAFCDGARHSGRTGARPNNPGGRQSFQPRIASQCHRVHAGGCKCCRRAVIRNDAFADVCVSSFEPV
jgi:hypothetical protein